ncbi:APC family permease [Cryptosporangium aurantiacum]|uniref:Amino acid exporter, AAE family n=1 Tax=Cryptosporangium aurantiacum TaxID=134849 RepID=A0A1M7MGH4_9ACTN|nr:amino acid permease [Cryptosporangium aurantiacum]SHM89978.1 amino acid exporter, AAE family [Cryptosporangium aurantiacum]
MTGTGRLSLVHGTALYVGAVLGTGVIALPALAAEVSGPASLVAWLLLVVASAPLAAAFAALGARYPDAGGVSTYARLAFGEQAATVVGWCFYFAVPPGASAAALFAGAYVESAVGGGTTTVAVSAVVLIAAVSVTNVFGVRLSGRVQFGLSVLLVTFLLVAVVLAVPHLDQGNLRPFAPHGWLAIGPTAALLVWSFVGWEVITHLTAEFRRPARDLPRATAAAVVIVGVLYLAVAFAVIGVLGTAAGSSDAPLGELLATAVGGNARTLAAVAAVLLTFGTINAYFAGAAKLGAALGRDGSLPSWIAQGSSAGEVPRRSLGVLVAGVLVALAGLLVAGIGPRLLVLVTTGLFVTVYAVGVAAAVKLLPTGGRAWVTAVSALGIVLVLTALTGRYLAWAVVVTAGALLYVRLRPRSRRRPRTEAEPEKAAQT